MNKLRNDFKKQAERNEQKLIIALGSDFQEVWKFIETCTKRMDICLNSQEVNQNKKFILTLLLSNTLSDLLCCFDSFERGHDQTVDNNLRMILEALCLAIHMFEDKTDQIFTKYMKNKHHVPDSIPYCKNNYPNYQNIGSLYGLLSKISHNSESFRVVRNIDRVTKAVYYLKPFKYDLNNQIQLILILHLFFQLSKLAEEITISDIKEPYFWKKIDKGWEERTDLPEYVLIQTLMHKLENSPHFTSSN